MVHPKFYCFPFETFNFCPGAYQGNLDREIVINDIYSFIPANSIPKILFGRYHRYCEKSPKNVLYIEKLLEAFRGEEKVIHVVRDGRDVITSEHPSKAAGILG